MMQQENFSFFFLTNFSYNFSMFNEEFEGDDGLNLMDLYSDKDSLYRQLLQEFRDALYMHTKPSVIVLLTLYIPIVLMAFFGNLMVLFVVLPNRRMRNVTNFFLVNLATADLTGNVI